jgi:hypothetical protein
MSRHPLEHTGGDVADAIGLGLFDLARQANRRTLYEQAVHEGG